GDLRESRRTDTPSARHAASPWGFWAGSDIEKVARAAFASFSFRRENRQVSCSESGGSAESLTAGGGAGQGYAVTTPTGRGLLRRRKNSRYVMAAESKRLVGQRVSIIIPSRRSPFKAEGSQNR